jgi:hypothetical protein
MLLISTRFSKCVHRSYASLGRVCTLRKVHYSTVHTLRLSIATRNALLLAANAGSDGCECRDLSASAYRLVPPVRVPCP